MVERRLYVLQARPLNNSLNGCEHWVVIHAPEEDVRVEQGMVVSIYHRQGIMQGEVGKVLMLTKVEVGFEVTAHGGKRWELYVPIAWAVPGPAELESGWEADRVESPSCHGGMWHSMVTLLTCGLDEGAA